MAEESKNKKDFDSKEASIVWTWKEQSKHKRRTRINLNRQNFDCYHLRADWTHKQEGQSREFLSKQSIAVEQITAFIKQGLLGSGDWFSIEKEGVNQIVVETEIKDSEMELLLNRQLENSKIETLIEDAIKLGLLGSLMIVKVHGKMKKTLVDVSVVEDADGNEVPQKKFKRFWQLKFTLVRQEDYFPDWTGDNQFEIERIEMDWYQLKRMADNAPDLFNVQAVENLRSGDEDLQQLRKSRETGSDQIPIVSRRRVVLYELWGNIIDDTTGEMLHENVQMIISDGGQTIMPPRKNPFWHQESPYVVSPIIRVPKSVWHKALMDATTQHNFSINEIYNLMFDSGMMAVHGIKQYREHWMEDPSEIEDGIAPGQNVAVSPSAPPNGKVIERVDTSTPNSTEGLNMFNLMNKELQASAITNDTRVGGIAERNVKATELVASNQSINSIFNSITGTIEDEFVKKLIQKSWLMQAQHINDLSDDSMKTLLGEERALFLAGLSKAQVFKQTAKGRKFKVFGLSATLNKIEDFRKWTALLQTIGSSPLTLNEFARKFSFSKLVGQIVESLDIDPDKIEADDEEKQEAAVRRQLENQRVAAEGGQNLQAQTPQAEATTPEGGLAVPRGGVVRGDGEGGPSI